LAADTGYPGFKRPTSGNDPWSAVNFMVRMILGELATATVVQVKGVTNAGGVAAVGSVDVLPLVRQVTPDGDGVPHGTVFGLPYMRMQGGENAVILDPQVGDIGIAVFASRDISSVKATKAEALPGSGRSFDYADGLYIGGVLNGTPTQYVRFAADGITLKSPTKVTLEAPAIELKGPVTGTSTAAFTGDVTGAGKSLSTHRHGGVTTGGGQTGVPV